MVYRTAPFSMTVSDPNPDFKVTDLLWMLSRIVCAADAFATAKVLVWLLISRRRWH